MHLYRKERNTDERRGHYEDSLIVFYLADRPRMKALRQRDCDLFAIETIPSLKEADAVLQTLKEHPSTKAWVTFSCQDGHSYKVSTKDDVLKTSYGDSWADSVVTLVFNISQ